jgi:hypothetical protein
MKTAADYRVMAEQCCKWAREAYPGEARKLYLELARFWLDVASRLDDPSESKQKRRFKAVLARARLQA